MKSKHIITTVICSVIASAMLLSSCKKVLEQEPRNSTYGDVFWKTSGDYESAMAGNYALLRDVMTSGTYNPSPRYYMYGDAVSNSYLTLQYVGDGLEAIQNGDITGNYNLKSLANWTKYYKAIAMSNLILSKVETLSSDDLSDVSNPETFKKKIKGQALFIRALCYFMMTRVWGDVPLVTTVRLLKTFHGVTLILERLMLRQTKVLFMPCWPISICGVPRCWTSRHLLLI
jgi:hypothetical protein